MKWKRVLPIALIAVLVLVAIGIYIVNMPPKIGIAIHDLSDSAAREYAQALEESLTARGYAVTVEDAKNDQSLQNQQIAAWAKGHYAAVIVSPVMVSAASETAEMAKQADMPIIFINKPVSYAALAVWEKVSYVGNPVNLWGECLGNAVLSLPEQGDINGDGVISYLLVQDDPENAQKQAGITQLLQTLGSGEKTFKEIRKIATNGQKSESNALCAQSLAQYGKDIEVVICDSEAGVLGAEQAIVEGGRVVGGDIYLVSLADTQQVLREIVWGNVNAVVYRDFKALAVKTAEVLKLLLDGEATENTHLVDCVTVTPENVISYLTFTE